MIEFNATFLVAMLSFVVFIFIMNTIFYRPILSIIRKREDYISNNYETAKNLEEKALNHQNQIKEKLQQSRIDCRYKIETAIDEAQKSSHQAIVEQKEKTKAQIQSEKEKLLADGKNLKQVVNSSIVSDLAQTLTDKIMKSEVKVNG